MLLVLSYNKELETEKLMKKKEQKLRDNFKDDDRAKITNKHGASLVTAVSIATKRLGTNDKLAKEEGGPQRGGQGPAARRKTPSTDQTSSS